MSLLDKLTTKDNDLTSNVDLVSITAVNHLYDKKNTKTNTRINKDQVGLLTKLYMFADVFKTPFTKNLADTIASLQVSLGGLGRKETIALVQRSKTEDIELPKYRDIHR